ncbi:MAG: sigma 54-interacting transcriptional regulator [Puniceicoccales bacterium]|jgi:transcriptional regulator with GAF, ATPase, and Fis domain|nr:sigma 54-interacting transcriptional regulator [Puniceicoccales bacterium]
MGRQIVPIREIEDSCSLSQVASALQELHLFDESLICDDQLPQPWEARTPELLSLEEAARRAGIYGNSPALRVSLDRLRAVAQNRAPVLFVGAPSSGKRTFAALLHYLTSLGTAQHCAIDCREISTFLNGPQALDDLVQSLRTELRPTLTLLHPESLPKRVRYRFFDIIATADGTVRFQVTVDRSFLPVFLRAVPPTVRALLRAQMVEVPDLHARREDLKFHVLAKLSELNGRAGVRKQISASALGRLIDYDFADNFCGLFRTLEWLHATQLGVLNFDETLLRDRSHLSPESLSPTVLEKGFRLESYLRSLREKLLREALRRSRNNFSQAARLLGVSPQAVSKSVKNFVAPARVPAGPKK